MKILKRTVSFILSAVIVFGIFVIPSAASDNKSFTEVSFDTLQYCQGKGNYKNLYDSSSFSYMDGIYIQTSSSSYKIEYAARDRTHDWNDWVWSTSSSDYAGWYKYNVTNVRIRVYDIINGIYDNNNYVVMYRAKSGSTWCSWVSNAKDYTMKQIKNEFGLDGEIDASATDAGDRRYGDITALQVHLYVRNGHAPSSSAKIIDVPYYNQNKIGLINGCESVSATMALNKAGYSITPEKFVNSYLDMGASKTDPNENYVGNPKDSSGWGCYNSVIKKDIDKVINQKTHRSVLLNGKSLDYLTSTYIDNGIPVIVWATVFMTDDYKYTYWTAPNGKYITYNNRLHCLLLVGYDSNYYYFNDPLVNVYGGKVTGYGKSAVSKAYNELGMQAVAIIPFSENGISVKSLPKKTVYKTGEKLVTDGLVIEASYSDGTKSVVTGYNLLYSDSIPGVTTVTVEYKSTSGQKLTTSFNVIYTGVNNASSEIILDTENIKTEYEIGQSPDFSALKVYEHKTVTEVVESGETVTNKTTDPITEGYSISEADMSKAGTQSITVSYNGNSCLFDITVYEGHVDGEAVTVEEPTCTEKGKATVYCRLCGEKIRDEELSALGHIFSEEYTVDIEPDYTTNGQKSRHCTKCSEITDITEIPRLISDMWGDVSGDNDVTMSDVLILRKYVAGVADIDEVYFKNGDTNNDDDITMSDVLIVRKIIAGIL